MKNTKTVSAIGIAGVLTVLGATGKLADFAHDQLGFMRTQDVQKLEIQIARLNAQLEVFISIYEKEAEHERDNTGAATGRNP